jgi:hypothetical protein
MYNPAMPNAVHYFAQFQSARGRFGTLPSWCRFIVGIFALPGIALMLLSIASLLVSILALLLLTVPVYQALQAVFGVRSPSGDATIVENPFAAFGFPSPEGPAGRRHVDAKVVDSHEV